MTAEHTTRPTLRGTFGMVSSTHWLASQSAMAELEAGGNAFDAAAHGGEGRRHAFGQRLGELASSPVVGQQFVPARLLDGRSEGPGPGHLHLEDAAEVLRLLLELVEVLGQQGSGATMVDARGVRQPPARGLLVEAEVGDRGQGAADHARRSATTRELGQVGQIRHLAEHDPDRLGVLLGVAAGPRPDSAGDRHRWTSTESGEDGSVLPTETDPGSPPPVADGLRR